MSKCFRPGLKYVFTKKKFNQDYPGACSQWVHKCNGREVTVEGYKSGYVNIKIYAGKMLQCGIHPDWCKCIGRVDNE